MKAKINLGVILITLLTVLTFSSQAQIVIGNYAKLSLGQVSPFDTAVAIQIRQYRMETLKLVQCDSTIAEFIKYNEGLLEMVRLEEGINEANTAIIKEKDAIIASKSEVINKMAKTYDNAFRELTRKKKFWEYTEFWAGVGMVTGYALSLTR